MLAPERVNVAVPDLITEPPTPEITPAYEPVALGLIVNTAPPSEIFPPVLPPPLRPAKVWLLPFKLILTPATLLNETELTALTASAILRVTAPAVTAKVPLF